MKDTPTTKTLLGTSQIETATLLNVSMGQYSMFESGKRKLPTAAMLSLSEMLTYMNTPAAHKAKYHTKAAVKHEAEIQKQLKSLHKENEFHLANTSRKIAKVLQKQEGNLKALHLAEFLHSKAANQKASPPEALEKMESRAVKELGKNGVALLLLQAKEQALKAQQVWIKERMDAKKP